MSKPTCGPLFMECLKYAIDNAPGPSWPTSMFSAGHMVGQAEKIYLGACAACMVRPSSEYRPWVLQMAVKISEVYGLQVSVFERPEIADEIWIHKPEARDAVGVLSQLEVNSPDWHVRRGVLCGVPDHEIDTDFHVRKGFGKPCDRMEAAT